MYDAYQSYADTTDQMRRHAANAEAMLCNLTSWASDPWANDPWGSMPRRIRAYYELAALSGFTHTRPAFNIGDMSLGGRDVLVKETRTLVTPFCNLLHFDKGIADPGPKVLLVAPMSGHFATLLRNTVRTLLTDHDVYITDWKNARDVPVVHGRFGFEEYIELLIRFVRTLGPQSHVVAVCQPAAAALAAAAIMAEDDDPDLPASLTLMAGPIDTRVNPTKVNELATSKPLEWFEGELLGVVPAKHPGSGRRVYPGFLQLSAFMSMNLDRHIKSFADLVRYRVDGDEAKADSIKAFYEEYFAIMDLPGEFYLETIERIFQEHHLPLGVLRYRDRTVDPRAIRKTHLLTVEGERDDICAPGQTLAAQDLCPQLHSQRKGHVLATGVGHYGVFSGRRWETQVYPILRDHVRGSM